MPRKNLATNSRNKIRKASVKVSAIPSESTSGTKTNKRLILNISLFLLGRDKMKDTYWTIVGSEYNPEDNKVLVAVSTIDGKMGTTLKNMRSHAADLASYLRDQKLVSKIPRVTFYVYKENEESYLDKLNKLIDSVEMDLKLDVDKTKQPKE